MEFDLKMQEKFAVNEKNNYAILKCKEKLF